MKLNDLLTSGLFLGELSFPMNRIQPWHGFLYLANVNDKTCPGCIKLGYTNYDIGRRADELQREDIDTVFYTWSSPNAQVLEKYIKEILRQFARKDGKKYQYEIFMNIPWHILIYTIRIIILWVYIEERWVEDTKGYHRILSEYFDGVSFNTIEYNNIKHYGRDPQKEVTDRYPVGTRVMAFFEGTVDNKSVSEWYPAKIIKFETNLVDKNSKKGKKREKFDAYEIEWEGDYNPKRQKIKTEYVKALYPEIDINRTLKIEELYGRLDLKIKSLDLKLKY